MKLNEAVRICATDLLATEPHIDVDHIVDCVEARYPEVIYDEQSRLARNATMRLAKEIMRGLSEDDADGAQMALPGLDLPSAVCVPNDGAGSFYYVRTDKATWPELLAARGLREVNVTRAQEKLDRFDEGLGALRPFMEQNPTITVADALRRMRDAGSAAA